MTPIFDSKSYNWTSIYFFPLLISSDTLTRDCTQLLNQSKSIDWASFYFFQLYTDSLSYMAVFSIYTKYFPPGSS